MNTAFRTDVGRIREINEDRAAVKQEASGVTLALLADGMGGHQAGDVASQTAIEVILDQLTDLTPEMTANQWEEALQRAVEKANFAIYRQASQQAELSGMGTTVVAAVTSPERLAIVHIGDSRAYLFHKGELQQLTDDHSLVNELLRSGQISADEARTHPRRNVLTRALGTQIAVEAEILHADWHEGDILLLCTDGLTNMVDDKTIVHILKNKASLAGKADRLVERALRAGGEDNITVVLVENNGPGKERRRGS